MESPTTRHLREMKKLDELVNEENISDFYTFKQKLGEGGFSTVYLGIEEKTQTKVAIKRIVKTKAFRSMNLYKEVIMLRKLGRHPNICAFIDLFANQRYYYVVLEYMDGGELLSVVIDHFEKHDRSYSEVVIAYIMRQIITAVDHCHKNEVIHLDLKPENVLVSLHEDFSDVTAVDPYNFKLADFGLSMNLTNGKTLKNITQGTSYYMPPERLFNSPFDFKADIWSIGVIMFVLLAGSFPFYGQDSTEILSMTLSSDEPDYSSFDQSISIECINFLKLCLAKSPRNRPTCSQLLQDDWLNGKAASTKELGVVINKLNKFNARQKFKAGIRALILTKRIAKLKKTLLGEMITKELIDEGFTAVHLLQLIEVLNKHLLEAYESSGDLNKSSSSSSSSSPQLTKTSLSNFSLNGYARPDLLTIDGLQTFFQQVFPKVKKSILVKMFVAFQNSKHPDKVDPRHILIALALKISTNHMECLSFAFDVFDLNRSAGITFSEYKDMVKFLTRGEPTKVSSSTLQDEFDEANVTKNEFLSREEFITMALQNSGLRQLLKRTQHVLSQKN